MLEFKNVSKTFGAIQALEDLSFTIESGEFVFIIGPSGAGKTSVLKLLIHEYPPTTGEIILDGNRIDNLKAKDVPLLRQQLGIVFQDFKLLPTRTVGENIELALAVKKVDKKEWSERVKHVLSLVGLSERESLFPSQLSGGELQRAAIARALVINPSLIFADEPTGNLDWETADGIMDLLVKINAEGKTVIVTTHNMEIIEKLKKRVIALSKGKLVPGATHHKHKKHENNS
jgi:cell division transport system ATP-binding protein